LSKFVGEFNEKDLPIIKDQWRNLTIDRLEEVLERPYQIDVFKKKIIFISYLMYSFRVLLKLISHLILMVKMKNFIFCKLIISY
jgi:hypothetical protein